MTPNEHKNKLKESGNFLYEKHTQQIIDPPLVKGIIRDDLSRSYEFLNKSYLFGHEEVVNKSYWFDCEGRFKLPLKNTKIN